MGVKHIKTFSRLSYFFRNLLALATGTTTQMIIQVISLPIFLSVLDIEGYAKWLLAYNIAQLSGLLDFGSISAAQNLIPLFNSRDERSRIELYLKQILAMLFLTNATFIFLLLMVQKYFGEQMEIRLMVIFILSNFLQSTFGLFEAMTRIDARVNLGLYGSNILRFMEFIGTIFGLLMFPRSIFEVALAALLIKLICFLLFLKFVPDRYRFFKIGRINLGRLIHITREGIPFFITKISDLIIISGLLVLLQGKFSSTQFVLFVTARTFFRLGLQITSVVNFSFHYEISRYWVANDYIRVRKLIRNCSTSTFVLSGALALLYFFCGNSLFLFWTNSKLFLTPNLIFWGACYSFILSVNQGQKTKFNAINLNFIVSLISIVFSLCVIIFVGFSGSELSVVNLFGTLAGIELLNYFTVAIITRNFIKNYFIKDDRR